MYAGLLPISEKGDKDTQLSELNVNTFRSNINVSRALLWHRDRDRDTVRCYGIGIGISYVAMA